MNGKEAWIWFAIGMIPYDIRWQYGEDERVLKIHAVFWRLEMLLQGEKHHYQWTLHVSPIKRLQAAIWMVVTHLRENDHSEGHSSE